jgi:lysophospholipase L1-like esterase
MRGAIKRRYDHLQRLAAAYGAKFIVFWQPLMWVETGRRDRGGGLINARFHNFKENFGKCYDAVAADLEKELYFVNFQNILLSRQEPVYDADGVHLNGVGNRLVAKAMARVLVERGW